MAKKILDIIPEEFRDELIQEVKDLIKNEDKKETKLPPEEVRKAIQNWAAGRKIKNDVKK